MKEAEAALSDVEYVGEMTPEQLDYLELITSASKEEIMDQFTEGFEELKQDIREVKVIFNF